MTVDEAEQVATWRYSGAWSIYNLESAQSLIDDLPSHYSIVFGENLIGFCCIGEEARVPGIRNSQQPLILGWEWIRCRSGAGTVRRLARPC
jgi:[ribosomal protein S18]-alanine N-acetyltransferase